MNWKDEVVEKVRALRQAYSEQFDYDLKRMFEDLKKKEATESARRASIKPLESQVPRK